jgi:hypothetical protein
MRSACVIALLFLAAVVRLAGAAETSFPFGNELIHDDWPVPGKKTMPMIQIEDDGPTTIDLFCGHVHAQSSVGDDGTIAIRMVSRDESQCDPQQIEGDDDLLDMLLHFTNWRRTGDVIEFSGPGVDNKLRYYLMTN